ncbi:MAG: DNA-3-methyladenine glycosylase [Deltaproteobacteria bacterium]|nr:DNA-3-methyladenine glycosylase [Deltaproteobacteria bacterium]
MTKAKFTLLPPSFFDRDAREVAKDLLGKIICRKVETLWLRVQIIETEAYLLEEKASHSSLGFTEKRKALFMPPGTIYMYYARGKDSLNVSCRGAGNAVLIKSGVVYPFPPVLGTSEITLTPPLLLMQKLNPLSGKRRPVEKLCSGQTLLCRSLNLKVPEWDQKQFDQQSFYISDSGCGPRRVIATTRLGIPKGRDEHLPLRYLDAEFVRFATAKQ